MNALLLAMVVLAGAGALAMAVFAGIRASELKRARLRLARIANQGKKHKPHLTKVTVRRDAADSSIKALDSLIKRLMPQPAKLRERLVATGMRISLGEYLLGSLVLGAGVAIVMTDFAGMGSAISLPLALAAGVGIPYLITGRMISTRQRKFLAQFAEAVELIVRGLKSGVPVNESIRLVGQEIPDPVGVEFREIMQSMVMGQNITDAFAAASKRINLPEFRFFVISLSIQQETGGNLAETLENLASIVRQRKHMKLKIRSISSEARASAYILGSLPFLMFGGLSVMSPDYMAILFDTNCGHFVIAGALTSLAIGVGVMIKMGKFDI